MGANETGLLRLPAFSGIESGLPRLLEGNFIISPHHVRDGGFGLVLGAGVGAGDAGVVRIFAEAVRVTII